MALDRRKKNILLIGIASTMFLTTACMPSKIQDKIDETESNNIKANESTLENNLETDPDNLELSDEQKKALDQLDKKTVEDAISENKLKVREEIKVSLPKERNEYKNPEEFSQFVSQTFYNYHTKEINASEFYYKLSPHFHEKFEDLLPISELDQIETFDILQDSFIEHLPASIIGYRITNLETDPRTKESSFYRMYELKNGEKIYYLTIIMPEGDQWLLLDDSPAPAYEIIKPTQDRFSEMEGVNQE